MSKLTNTLMWLGGTIIICLYGISAWALGAYKISGTVTVLVGFVVAIIHEFTSVYVYKQSQKGGLL